MKRRTRALVMSMVLMAVSAAQGESRHDDFAHLLEINKASLVMLIEQELVPKRLAKEIANRIVKIDAEQEEPGSARSGNYLDFEARLLEISGPNASRLHTDRSRQGIGSTTPAPMTITCINAPDAMLLQRRLDSCRQPIDALDQVTVFCNHRRRQHDMRGHQIALRRCPVKHPGFRSAAHLYSDFIVADRAGNLMLSKPEFGLSST